MQGLCPSEIFKRVANVQHCSVVDDNVPSMDVFEIAQTKLASFFTRQPNIAWSPSSTGPQVFTGLDLIAKIRSQNVPVYDLTAIDK
jgi:hypothetical protein